MSVMVGAGGAGPSRVFARGHPLGLRACRSANAAPPTYVCAPLLDHAGRLHPLRQQRDNLVPGHAMHSFGCNVLQQIVQHLQEWSRGIPGALTCPTCLGGTPAAARGQAIPCSPHSQLPHSAHQVSRHRRQQTAPITPVVRNARSAVELRKRGGGPTASGAPPHLREE